MSRRKAFDTSLTGSSTSGPGPKAKTGGRSAPPVMTPPDPATTSATVPTTTREEKAAEQAESPTPPEVDDNELCFICAEPITFFSVGVCGHRTCHVCAIRLRVFYKKKECTFCKTPTPSLLFSRTPDVPFPDEHHITPSPPDVIAAAAANAEKMPKGQKWDQGLTLPGTLDVSKFPYADEKLSVVFQDEDMMEATLLLLRFNCPYPDCAHMASDWASLERHTLSTHGLVLCNLCRRQLSRFAHEQVLYPPGLLPLHDPSLVKRGQRAPRPRGQKEEELVRSWEAPHPMCEFCHEAFFGPDELFAHMRSKHEECFVCRGLGEKDVYFPNYNKLEQHFNADHYPCTQPVCLEKKFVVFPSDMDLRVHMVTEVSSAPPIGMYRGGMLTPQHGENMSARDKAQARQVPMDFQPGQSGSSGQGGRRRRDSHGRGFTLGRPAGAPSMRADRDGPQHQQISQPPLMSDAQAAQRERQLRQDRQEETSRRRRAFDTGLTGEAGDAGAGSGSATPAARRQAGGSGAVTPREDVDDAVAERHAALLNRIDILTKSSPNKLASFRSAVRQFRNNESRPKDLVDTVFHVLDTDVDATLGIMREIAGLFDIEGDKEKTTALLSAINTFPVEQREQFPGLPSAPTGLGSNYAGITSGAILNAKRSTQTHRRGAQTVWDRVEAAAAAHPANRPTTNAAGRYVPGSSSVVTAAAFPSLGAGPSSSSSSAAITAAHSTPWASGGAGSSSKAPAALVPQIRSVNFPTASAGRSKPVNLSKSAFPSLPPASKSAAEERKALFNKPNQREETIRRITGQGPAPPVLSNGWGTGGSGSGRNGAALNDADAIAQGVQDLGVGGDSGPAPAAGKKKGKQKQLLFSVSARPQ